MRSAMRRRQVNLVMEDQRNHNSKRSNRRSEAMYFVSSKGRSLVLFQCISFAEEPHIFPRDHACTETLSMLRLTVNQILAILYTSQNTLVPYHVLASFIPTGQSIVGQGIPQRSILTVNVGDILQTSIGASSHSIRSYFFLLS